MSSPNLLSQAFANTLASFLGWRPLNFKLHVAKLLDCNTVQEEFMRRSIHVSPGVFKWLFHHTRTLHSIKAFLQLMKELENDGHSYNVDGFDEAGYDHRGYNADCYDKQGFNQDGFNRDGYTVDGYDIFGYDKNGYDVFDCDRHGKYYDEALQQSDDSAREARA
jgi:hypothetical protein